MLNKDDENDKFWADMASYVEENPRPVGSIQDPLVDPHDTDAPHCAISFVDAFDFDEASIPPRPWLIPGAMLAGSTHILAAPGGTGKSLFTLQMALMLASGGSWGRWTPARKCRVLIINAEDDIDEQHRRLSAARNVMGMDTAKMAGMVIVAKDPASVLIASLDKSGKVTSATPLVAQLRAVIKHHKIDVVIVDPFAETFDGDENSNNDGKWAMKIWRDEIARATGCAVYLVHHTTKGAGDKAGSADVIRGAGALVNSARLAATLFVMTEKEAAALGVSDEVRNRYVRYDDAKSNQSLVGSRHWFEKISVRIRNGNPGDSEGGDEVGALKPWEPNGIAGFPASAIMALLEAINVGYIDEDGLVTDLPFGRTSAGGSKRWVGYPISEHLEVDEDKARVLAKAMMDKCILVEEEFEDFNKGRAAKGIRADLEAARAIVMPSPN